jgi:8-oxo-dGTP diphosphatase
MPLRHRRPDDYKYDVFVSFAMEDHDALAGPLVQELRDAGLRVWFAPHNVGYGESLTARVEEGLAQSRFLVAVLSKRAFAKKWVKAEIRSMLARELDLGSDHVIPVLFGITHAEVQRELPLLAQKLSIDAKIGVEAVSNAIMNAVSTKSARSSEGRALRASVAVVERNGQFLVVRRVKEEMSLRWAFPAGIVRPSEESRQAAVRETEDETGITCRIVRKIGRRVHPETRTTLIYWLCKWTGGKGEVRAPKELAEVKWVTGREALQLFTSDVYPPIKKLLKRRQSIRREPVAGRQAQRHV